MIRGLQMKLKFEADDTIHVLKPIFNNCDLLTP